MDTTLVEKKRRRADLFDRPDGRGVTLSTMTSKGGKKKTKPSMTSGLLKYKENGSMAHSA